MPKSIGVLMAVGGVTLVIASMMIMGVPDHGKWFPVFFLGGGALLWIGVKKYRAAA